MAIYMWKDYEWQPGENTLLYMTLNGTAKDEVSGNNGTRRTTASYTTLDSGLKVARTTTSNYIITPSVNMNTQMTVSGWMYRYSGDYFFRADRSSNRSFWQLQMNNQSPSYGGGGYWKNSVFYGLTGGAPSSSGWNHCVLTCGPNGVRVYTNGALIYKNAFNTFEWRAQSRGLNFDQSSSAQVNSDGMASNLIIENKIRTEDDVKDYYNSTKALYGIS